MCLLDNAISGAVADKQAEVEAAESIKLGAALQAMRKELTTHATTQLSLKLAEQERALQAQAVSSMMAMMPPRPTCGIIRTLLATCGKHLGGGGAAPSSVCAVRRRVPSSRR
jgi:hypothetical protein